MLTNHKIFLAAPLTASTTSADETVCTRQPRLRPGCCLHTVSSLYVIVVHGPLTPLAMYGHLDALLDGPTFRLYPKMGQHAAEIHGTAIEDIFLDPQACGSG